MKKLLLLPFLLLLASCTQSDIISIDNQPHESIIIEEAFTPTEVEQEYGKAFANASKLQLFLYEDLSTVTFEGEGNEYASYTVQTTWLSDHYVRYEQDNGGVVLAKYYRVNGDGIFLVDQVVDEAVVKTVADLEQLPVLTTILIAPITVGTSFDGWTITATQERYKTPYDTFDEVVVLEKQVNLTVERQYYVAGVGAIASEFETTDDFGETFVVTSKLKSIEF